MTDDPLKDMVEKLEAERLLVLRKAYETTGGVSNRHSLDRREMANAVGLGLGATRNAVDHLCGQGLLKHSGTSGFMITHEGCREVERLVKDPVAGSEHFSAGAIHIVQNNFHAPVGAVQTGNRNAASVDNATAAVKPNEE